MNHVSRASFFVVYRAFLWPLLRFAFSLLGLFNSKIREGLRMRAADASGRKPWLAWAKAQKPIWIHCASGEFEYAKPVIQRLKAKAPDRKILVTYFSPSVAKAAARFPGVDFATPSPWENPSDLKEFIEWHQPSVLLISRTDTWPEMLRQARRHSIPTLLFSATLPAHSGRARGLGRWMSRAAFSHLDQIYCVNEEDFEVFDRLGLKAVTRIMGDTRYDQVMSRLATPKPIRDELFKDALPEDVLVAGSTWEEDEAVLIEVIGDMRKNRLRFVLVPHEPTDAHLESLENQLAAKGIWSVRYSRGESWPAGSVLLVDQVGILAELYQKGRFAFVGGSFKKQVHSVMEPLAAGAITFVGPKHLNNREAIEFQGVRAGSVLAVQAAEDAQDLFEKIGLAQRDFTAEVTERIREEVRKRSGKSDAVAEWCLGALRN